MKYDQEYIYTLLLRKQLGELSEVEETLLQNVIHTDEQVRKCYYEQEEAKLYTDNAFLDDLRIEHDWCKVAAVLAPKPLHTRIALFVKRNSAIAAAFATAVVCAAGWLADKRGYFQKPTEAPAYASMVYHKAPSVVKKTTPAPDVVSPDTTVCVGTNPVLIAGNFPLGPAEDTAASQPIHPLSGRQITHDSIYQSSTIEWNTLAVPPRMDYRIELSDGTEVHLNASSTLRFPFIFPGRTREVYLEGEAFFTVAHDPQHPFIVHTGTTSVIALGTAFNVNSYDHNMITTSLVTGSVVTDVGDSLDVTLKPGYEAIYKPGERFKVKRFDENVTLGWRDGIFRFHNKPLEDIIPVMKRWFGLKVSFATPSMANLLVSGDLDKDKPVADFLNAVCQEKGLDFKIYDGTIHFTVTKK
ncbi:FecR domain-containing protein [Chitinophaga filiformis]|uniref:FecR family protein n=1 Tax=Chitinophaga filiformis TaxID=104663 RepID=UPI001F3E943D|nr:FecR domain-containing protein [Chitinophaga filiformis]MCF6402523.1 FecR domain-containing protein [Chitinophaga filiformis]